jgi:aminodeoxyfutalosine synthase
LKSIRGEPPAFAAGDVSGFCGLLPMAFSFPDLREKVLAGGRLSAAEAEGLYRPEVDLHALGRLADEIRRRRHGNRVYYNLNAHLNPTNVCEYRCPLCAYSCDPDDRRAHVAGLDEILARGQEAADSGCTELHIVGGLHPQQPWTWYRDIVRVVHESFPRLHLKAWTAVEIDWFARRAGLSIQAVLEALVAVGLGSLPGGGAEIFHPQVRQQISPRKADADTWLAVHRTAHGLGLRSTATMLFGHVETPAQRVDHLLRLRALQDETGGFQAFIPLAFHPENTRLAHLERPSGLDALRTVAVARLVLDNFPHVKAYWISLGVGTAQVALAYGADDLDGTVRHERIHHDAGAQSPEILSVEELETLIREAGCEPRERDSLYRLVRRSGSDWTVEADGGAGVSEK